MEMDEETKRLAEEVGTAINESVENSTKVAEAIERLRDAGYEMELTLRLEIGLRPHSIEEESNEEEAALRLTDEDLQNDRDVLAMIDRWLVSLERGQ